MKWYWWLLIAIVILAIIVVVYQTKFSEKAKFISQCRKDLEVSFYPNPVDCEVQWIKYLNSKDKQRETSCPKGYRLSKGHCVKIGPDSL